MDVCSFPGLRLASSGCIPAGGAAGPCHEAPALGTQNQAAPSCTDTTVLSGAILSESLGGKWDQEHGGGSGSLGAQSSRISDSCLCTRSPQDRGL